MYSSKEPLNTAICVFVYARPVHTRATLHALLSADGSAKYPVYVYCDGPKNDDDLADVAATRAVVSEILAEHPNRTEIVVAEKNKGLARSIIDGVTAACHQFDAVIVLEDDIVLAKTALSYFQSALIAYQDIEVVASVSGFAHSPKLMKIPTNYPFDTYFVRRNSSWGWATWSKEWMRVDWSLDDWERLRVDPVVVSEVARVGADLPAMLDAQAQGAIDSWAVRFTFHHIRNGLLSLVPAFSQTRNIGMDGSGTHTPKTSRYDVSLENATAKSTFPPFPFPDSRIEARFAKVYAKRSFAIRVLRKLLRLMGAK